MEDTNVQKSIDLYKKQIWYTLFQHVCTDAILIGGYCYRIAAFPNYIMEQPKLLAGAAGFIVISKLTAAYLFRHYLRNNTEDNANYEPAHGFDSMIPLVQARVFWFAFNIVSRCREAFSLEKIRELKGAFDLIERHFIKREVDVRKEVEGMKAAYNDKRLLNKEKSNRLFKEATDRVLNMETYGVPKISREVKELYERPFVPSIRYNIKEFNKTTQIIQLLAPLVLFLFDLFDYIDSRRVVRKLRPAEDGDHQKSEDLQDNSARQSN